MRFFSLNQLYFVFGYIIFYIAYLFIVAKYNLYYFHCAVGCVAQLVERRSLTGELSLSCARPAADG